MKKVICCLFLMILLMPCIALAEEAVLPTDPFSWDYLLTIAGCTVATLLLVQLLKLPIDRIWKIPTRIIVFAISFVIMLLASYFTGNLSWSSAVLTIFNSAISALSAMGSYELTFAKIEKKN